MRKFFVGMATIMVAIVLLATACGAGPTAEPAAASATPPPPPPTIEAATPVPPTPTEAPASTPTPESTMESVTLEFQNTIASIEDADRVLHLLEDMDGVRDGLATEDSIKIRYDPEVISLEDIRTFVERQGIPLK
jgi:hypothetical protein